LTDASGILESLKLECSQEGVRRFDLSRLPTTVTKTGKVYDDILSLKALPVLSGSADSPEQAIGDCVLVVSAWKLQ
jgi:hypothetical protein